MTKMKLILLAFTFFACVSAQNRQEDFEKLQALAKLHPGDLAKASRAFWELSLSQTAKELLRDPVKFAANIPIGSLICGPIQKYLPPGFNCSVNTLEQAAELYLKNALHISPGCATDLSYGLLGNFLAINIADLGAALASESTFSLRQIDAWGKPDAGLLVGNHFWTGFYGECTRITADITAKNTKYQGKYCNVYVSFYALLAALFNPLIPGGAPKIDYCSTIATPGAAITWGVCMPAQCSDQDVTILTYMLTNSSGMTSPVCGAKCIPHLPVPWTTEAIIILALLCSFGAACLFASLFDYFIYDSTIDDSRSPFIKILMAFSFFANVKRMFDTTTKPGQINSIHGLRFISMSWVIIGHSYLWLFQSNNVTEVLKLKNKFTFQTLMNATFAVDTFFLLSGTLLAYLWFKEMFRSKGKTMKSPFTWILFYLHRYLRLTPVYAIIFFSQNALYQYATRGPNWSAQALGHDNCLKYWWTHMLYINNLVYPTADKCHQETWYLANDMQFHVFSPLILVPLWLFWPIGVAISVVLILASMAVTAWSYVHWHLPAPLAFSLTYDPDAPKDVGDLYWAYMYVSPWTRYAPYIIGILLGYFMQIRPKMKIHPVINAVIWCAAAAIASGILYGLLTYAQGTLWSVAGRAVYSAFCRPLWSLAVGWVIYACFTGNGGPVNAILSWKVWIPLSRLTYCAYLLHITCAVVLGDSYDFPLHWTGHFNWLLTFSSALMILAYLVSFFTSACFEMPIANLEGMLFPRKNRAKKVDPEPKRDDQPILWDSSVRPYQNGQVSPLISVDSLGQNSGSPISSLDVKHGDPSAANGVSKRNPIFSD